MKNYLASVVEFSTIDIFGDLSLYGPYFKAEIRERKRKFVGTSKDGKKQYRKKLLLIDKGPDRKDKALAEKDLVKLKRKYDIK